MWEEWRQQDDQRSPLLTCSYRPLTMIIWHQCKDKSVLGVCETSVQPKTKEKHLEKLLEKAGSHPLDLPTMDPGIDPETVLYCLALFGLGPVTSNIYQATWEESSPSQPWTWSGLWIGSSPLRSCNSWRSVPQTQSNCRFWKDPLADYLLFAYYSLGNMISEQTGRDMVQKEHSRKIPKEVLIDIKHTHTTPSTAPTPSLRLQSSLRTFLF